MSVEIVGHIIIENLKTGKYSYLGTFNSNFLNNHLDIDFNKYAEVVAVVCMILEGEVCTSTQCGEFYDLRKQYRIHNNFQLTILGMIYLVEKENT